MEGLFGADFEIDLTKTKSTVKQLMKKIDTTAIESDADAAKILKSKKLTIQERLEIIRDRVIKVLGKQRGNTIVIKNFDDFSAYIDAAIKAGFISVDTETNNSLDPVTCKLMGLCLYVPGQKQAYIPVNHVDFSTETLLPDQLTEAQIACELQRIIDSKTFVVMHNGKFDYEVIKATTGVALTPHWDTMVAARLLNENELAGLKYQYVTKIDKSQEKYDIEALFENISYAFVEPEIFALYAATDSLMTYKLFELQKQVFEADNDLQRLYWVYQNIELPLVTVTANMELRGMKVNTNLGAKLKQKYNQQLEAIDKAINDELTKMAQVINAWKIQPENAAPVRVYVPKKSKMAPEKIEAAYPLIDEKGNRYKMGKAKVEQLSDPVNLASPTQLAILFYDILKCPVVNKKEPRSTGEDELKDIVAKCPDLVLCKLVLERRGLAKLISTYIDVIPELAAHWPDGRIRFHLNQMGTDTGRYSSGGKLKFFENGEPIVVSGINIQNIPSHNKEIRMLFQADTKYNEISAQDNCFEVPEYEEVETTQGWKYAGELAVGDKINLEMETGTETCYIQEIQKIDKIYRIRV